jgi:HK97 family phage major capsid protein
MTAVQNLLDQRANVWDQMVAVMERETADGKLSVEDSTAYDNLDAEYERLTKNIERKTKHEQRDTANSQVDRSGAVPAGGGSVSNEPTDSDKYAAAFRNFLRDGMAEMEPADKQILRAGLTDLPKNAAGVGTGAAGGYAVPPEFRNIFVETMKWFGPMLQVSEIIETDSGVNLPWPTNDDTANVGAILAENTQVTEQDVTLGTNSLDAFMYTSKLVRVSLQLLQDRPDFDTWLARKLGERVGRILNQHFTTGTGTAQPDGFVTSATVGATGSGSFATTGGITYASLVDLIESLDPAYGAGEGLQFMLHQTARKAFRKVLDAQNRPIWEPSVQAGQPDSLLGYGVSLNNDMPTLAQNSKSVAFGNFREAYAIRIVKGLTTMRLTERYADFLQVGFLAFERADGTLQNANAVKLLQTTPTA